MADPRRNPRDPRNRSRVGKRPASRSPERSDTYKHGRPSASEGVATPSHHASPLHVSVADASLQQGPPPIRTEFKRTASMSSAKDMRTNVKPNFINTPDSLGDRRGSHGSALDFNHDCAVAVDRGAAVPRSAHGLHKAVPNEATCPNPVVDVLSRFVQSISKMSRLQHSRDQAWTVRATAKSECEKAIKNFAAFPQIKEQKAAALARAEKHFKELDEALELQQATTARTVEDIASMLTPPAEVKPSESTSMGPSSVVVRELEQVRSETAALRDEHHTLKNDNVRLGQDYVDLKNGLKTLQQQNSDLKADNEKLRGDLAALEQRMSDRCQELDTRATVREISDTLNKTIADGDSKSNEFSDVKRSVAETRAKMLNVEKSTVNRLNDLDTRQTSVLDSKNQLSKVVANTERKIGKLEAGNETMMDLIRNLETLVHNLSDQIQSGAGTPIDKRTSMVEEKIASLVTYVDSVKTQVSGASEATATSLVAAGARTLKAVEEKLQKHLENMRNLVEQLVDERDNVILADVNAKTDPVVKLGKDVLEIQQYLKTTADRVPDKNDINKALANLTASLREAQGKIVDCEVKFSEIASVQDRMRALETTITELKKETPQGLDVEMFANIDEKVSAARNDLEMTLLEAIRSKHADLKREMNDYVKQEITENIRVLKESSMVVPAAPLSAAPLPAVANRLQPYTSNSAPPDNPAYPTENGARPPSPSQAQQQQQVLASNQTPANTAPHPACRAIIDRLDSKFTGITTQLYLRYNNLTTDELCQRILHHLGQVFPAATKMEEAFAKMNQQNQAIFALSEVVREHGAKFVVQETNLKDAEAAWKKLEKRLASKLSEVAAALDTADTARRNLENQLVLGLENAETGASEAKEKADKLQGTVTKLERTVSKATETAVRKHVEEHLSARIGTVETVANEAKKEAEKAMAAVKQLEEDGAKILGTVKGEMEVLRDEVANVLGTIDALAVVVQEPDQGISASKTSR